MIPRILHQLWNTEETPAEWQFCVESWRRHHPDWEFRLWTASQWRELVRVHYPDFLPTYDACSYDIQRIDAVRYLILHHVGGVYADLDLECLQPVDGLIERGGFMIGREPEAHEQRGGVSMLCNAFMAASRGHAFLEHTVDVVQRRNQAILVHEEVLAPAAFYPLAADSAELRLLLASPAEAEPIRRACRERGAYGVHYWANSWIRNLAGELRNPHPRDVPGYVFCAGLDSWGHDLANVGRDIDRLVAACDADERAVAFNTDGFLKYALRPQSAWTEMSNAAGNEGLYVKCFVAGHGRASQV